MDVYLVGGAVRDRLLGLPVEEKDWVVVGATPEEMLALGYKQVGKDFPVFLHPETHEEYALARTERKTGPGYKGFAFHAAPDVTLEQDLARRDLTINAMAEAADGTLIDPYDGQADLDNGRLRHISPAFAEDPVRILRVARFAARFGRWGFSVAHGTNALMRKMVADGEVDHLVPERVWAELVKALRTERPEKFFTVLHGCHALATLFPEIEQGYAGSDAGHGGTGLPTALTALADCAARNSDPRIRFAALLLATGGHLPADEHRSMAAALCERYRVPGEYTQLVRLAIDTASMVNSENSEDLLSAMEAAAAFGNSSRWDLLLELFLATGTISRQRHEQLLQWQQQAATVTAASLNDQTLQGPQIGAAIRQGRYELIEQARQNRD